MFRPAEHPFPSKFELELPYETHPFFARFSD
jgi:hypothetical protein